MPFIVLFGLASLAIFALGAAHQDWMLKAMAVVLAVMTAGGAYLTFTAPAAVAAPERTVAGQGASTLPVPTAAEPQPYDAASHIHSHIDIKSYTRPDIEEAINEAAATAATQMDVFIYSATISEADVAVLRNQVGGASRRVYIVASPGNTAILPSPDLANVLTPDVQQRLISDALHWTDKTWGAMDTFTSYLATDVSKVLAAHQEFVQDQQAKP